MKIKEECMFGGDGLGSYPAGAYDDSRAPYNEPLNDSMKIECSMIFDGEITIEYPQGSDSLTIRTLAMKTVQDKAELIAKSHGLTVTDVELI